MAKESLSTRIRAAATMRLQNPSLSVIRLCTKAQQYPKVASTEWWDSRSFWKLQEFPGRHQTLGSREISPAESLGQLRVKDESGEDHLYRKGLFVSVDLPSGTEEAGTTAV